MKHPKVSDLTRQISALYHQLASAPSLVPSPEINELFGRLVELTNTTSDSLVEQVLADPKVEALIADLHQLSARGEGLLEAKWAEQISSSRHPLIELERFPYYGNYRELGALEYHSWQLLSDHRVRRVLFIGGGPLPLTSIVLARTYGLEVTNLDNDRAAIESSERLIDSLELGDLIRITEAEADTYEHYDQYDAIILAALVGLTRADKAKVLAKLHLTMQPGALLLVRSADGMRQLLYPTVHLDDLEAFELQLLIRPLGEVVNSVIIMQQPSTQLISRIRYENANDARTLADFRQFALASIGDQYGYPYNPRWHADLEAGSSAYTGDRTTVIVGRLDNQVIASIAVRPYDRDYPALKGRYGQETASIWRYFVAAEFQSKGIEEELLRRATDFARAHGYTKLYAHDQRDVAGALGKYSNAGFDVVYESHDPYGTVHFDKAI